LQTAVPLLLALAACASTPITSAPAEPTTPAAPDIVARSHAILAALDHHDVAVAQATLADDFLHFEGEVIDKRGELKQLAARPMPHDLAIRTWSEERVFVRPGGATFVGKAREHAPGDDSHGGGYNYDGWFTLAWSEHRGNWQLEYLGWQIDGAAARSAEWNQIFEHGTGFEHAPNRLLVDTASHEHAGVALDVAMGQGRNAIYLAAQGWHVTGVDFSEEAIHEAQQTAAKQGAAIETVNADLKTYDYGSARYDLVALMYAFPAIDRLADVARAVKPGGLVVYEYFSKDAGRNDDAPAPGDIAKAFAGFDVLRDEVVEDVPDWAMDRAKVERFVARKRM
jgi:ubiquinone/menaquinone biosynthesis C-methylase UbiE